MRLSSLIFVSFWTTLQFCAFAAHATVTFSSSEGHSTVESAGASNVTIYGGLVGASCSTGSGVCDNCATAAYNTTDLANGGCNNRRINPNTNLQISFISDEADGYPILLNSAGTIIGARGNVRISKGQLATLTIPWSTICPQLEDGGIAGDTTCAPAAGPTGVLTGTGFKLGLDTNGTNTITGGYVTVTFYAVSKIDSTAGSAIYLSGSCADANTTADSGACEFALYPGDTKAWIEDINIPNSFPNGKSSLPFRTLRFYYVLGDPTAGSDWAKLTPSASYTDFSFSGTPGGGDFTLSGKFIDGLTNQTVVGSAYLFTMASVDAAGNVGYFLDPTAVSHQTAAHYITPSEVSGLLSKQFNCFVATAAYGSPFESKVKTLRAFRDQYLETNAPGRMFVRWYYRNSPPFANWIAKNETLRASARAVLWPAWAVSSLMLQYGASTILLALLFMTLAFGWFSHRVLHRRRSSR